MRLDMFLKQSGLVKRRPIAKALCDGGKIERNNRPAKAGDDVRIGDSLRLHFGSRTIEAEILSTPERPVSKAQRDELFRITSEQRHDDLDF
jgi:ribosomal 50S subunit-recycling heat shock protein